MIKSIKKIINERHSVRAYSDKKIEPFKKNSILQLMNDLKTQNFRFELVDYTFDNNKKIGTYGMISGAHSFIIGILNREMFDNIDISINFGEKFEQLILKATSLDLATCWMVSTFKSEDIKDLINLDANEDIVMVSPIGYGNEKSIKHRVTRFVTRADKRKPWRELFYTNDFEHPLENASDKRIFDILEGVRQSPSAANKQPWKIIKTDMIFDFYINPKTYMNGKNQKIDVTYNDMGIAKCHFDLMAKYHGFESIWFKKENPLESNIYVGSIKLKEVSRNENRTCTNERCE